MEKKFGSLEEGIKTTMITDDGDTIKKEKVFIEYFNKEKGKVVYRKYNPDKYEEFSFKDGNIKVKNVFFSQLLRNNKIKLSTVGILYTILIFNGCNMSESDVDSFTGAAAKYEEYKLPENESILIQDDRKEEEFSSQNFRAGLIIDKADEYYDYLKEKEVEIDDPKSLIPLVIVSNISNINYDAILSMLDEGYLDSASSNQILEESNIIINKLIDNNFKLLESNSRSDYIDNQVSFSNLIINDYQAEELINNHKFLLTEYLYANNLQKKHILLNNNILVMEGKHPDLDLSEMNLGVNYLINKASIVMQNAKEEGLEYRLNDLAEISDDQSELLDTLVYKIGLTKGGINLK